MKALILELFTLSSEGIHKGVFKLISPDYVAGKCKNKRKEDRVMSVKSNLDY
jgi:hypothetical protein